MRKRPADAVELIATSHIAGSAADQRGMIDEPHESSCGAVTEWTLDRRHFMQLMWGSLGATGLAGCLREPDQEIVPYLWTPERAAPGSARYYSSVFTRNGYGYGVVVKSDRGHPTKIEGNPAHPASRGASDVFMQAELLNLYDPNRSRGPLENGQLSTLDRLQQQLAAQQRVWRNNGGRGLHILTPPLSSPSLAAQLQQLLERYPHARWHQWQPVNEDCALAGARLAFGRDLAVDYRLQQAEVVLQLGGDLLTELPGSLVYARELAIRRDPQAAMSRVYAVESSPGLLGALADYRLALRVDRIGALAWQLAELLRGSDGFVDASGGAGFNPRERDWLHRCARDLHRQRGRALVVAGRDQPPAVHALVHWLNDYLGNSGVTVRYREPPLPRPEVLTDSLRQLVDAMVAGEVESLLLLDCNPVFDAPADYQFARHLQQVPWRLHLGAYVDETAAACQWHLPLSHMLESWGDARAYDGTAAVQQPVIAPLYASVSLHSLLAFSSGDGWRSDYEVVRGHWARSLAGADAEQAWRRLLIDGVQADSALPPIAPQLQSGLPEQLPRPAPVSDDGLLLQFVPGPQSGDGRYTKNSWLQELPDPFSKLTWGNALSVPTSIAAEHDLHNGELVEVSAGGQTLTLPVWIAPEHADGAVTIYLGYGREVAGQRVGVNVYPLRRSDNPALRPISRLRKTGWVEPLAVTQRHSVMEERAAIKERAPVRETTLAQFQRDPQVVARDAPAESLYPEPTPPPFEQTDGYAWAMTIDLNACIGCGVCTLACQTENNIPTVGREQVLAGRAMHWMRIDRYYQFTASGELRTLFQPMLCQHCENAPCEYVCPVGATLHDSEGLNVMVYNRCVGARDCSRNCPYQVRRFNFLDYSEDENLGGAVLAPLRNPDVTVRSRGVMEKCTYCLQRLSSARREAKKAGRRLRDGDVRTACQQACPTQAICFGDSNDSAAAISAARAHPLNYSVLAELNTRPRTTYIARVRNRTQDQDSGKGSGVVA